MGDMIESIPADLAALQFGGATVAENIGKAIASGALIERPDGMLQTPTPPRARSKWMIVDNGPPLDCGFLTHLCFEIAYAKTALPYGCRSCYKVKLSFTSLRALRAGWNLARKIPCLSKWGLDYGNPYSQDIYAGYFYATGLAEARALYRVVRDEVDSDPKMGEQIKMLIKRGCSQFEAAVGPSDRFTVTPEQEALEIGLRARFRPHPTSPSSYLTMLGWIDFAYQIGDDTYLDFTGGKPLRRASVSYVP